MIKLREDFMKKEKQNGTIIYQAKTGAIELTQDANVHTVWATQNDIAEIFDIERSVVTKHVRNVLKDKELNASSVCAKMARTADDGKTYQVQFYSLDVILAVGYRTNSSKAIAFRQWATQTLKSHITEGYTINRKRIKANYDEFIKAVDDVKSLLPVGVVVDNESVLELIKLFADTWFSLDAYDKDQLPVEGTTKKKVKLTAEKLSQGLAELKQVLIAKGEATDIFGAERTKDSVAGIIGNVMQSFGGEELYPTAETKAANLLYFIVKNHPFVDGNKRSGAYAFVWYLRQAKILDVIRMSPPVLTAITLLIAESSPKDKAKMVGLVCRFLMKGQGG
jgi:prophage maintenance system killer protein